MSTAAPPPDLLHIATPSEWEAATQTGEIAPPSLATEGFVHCSTRQQLAGTLARHFTGAGPLVLLTLDAAAVAGDLRWEEGQPGQAFPHVYAPIPVEAVISIEQIEFLGDTSTDTGDV
jgi:uncharacterized protein (DUF952 family)